jgi:hypothetical protein
MKWQRICRFQAHAYSSTPLALFFSLILSFPYFMLFPSKGKFLSNINKDIAFKFDRDPANDFVGIYSEKVLTFSEYKLK